MGHPKKRFFFLARSAYAVRREYANEMMAFREGYRKNKPKWRAMCRRVFEKKIPPSERRYKIEFQAFFERISELNREVKKRKKVGQVKRRRRQMKIFDIL